MKLTSIFLIINISCFGLCILFLVLYFVPFTKKKNKLFVPKQDKNIHSIKQSSFTKTTNLEQQKQENSFHPVAIEKEKMFDFFTLPNDAKTMKINQQKNSFLETNVNLPVCQKIIIFEK